MFAYCIFAWSYYRYVRLGEYDSSRTTDGQTTDYRVINIYRHEHYVSFQHDDIAVLKLDRTVVYNGN